MQPPVSPQKPFKPMLDQVQPPIISPQKPFESMREQKNITPSKKLSDDKLVKPIEELVKMDVEEESNIIEQIETHVSNINFEDLIDEFEAQEKEEDIGATATRDTEVDELVNMVENENISSSNQFDSPYEEEESNKNTNIENTFDEEDEEDDEDDEDDEEKIDFLNTDALYLRLKSSEDMLNHLSQYAQYLGDSYSENLPRWRLHYERTGKVNIKFRGESSLQIKLKDVKKGNMKFLDAEKTTINVNDTTNKLILIYESKRKLRARVQNELETEDMTKFNIENQTNFIDRNKTSGKRLLSTSDSNNSINTHQDEDLKRNTKKIKSELIPNTPTYSKTSDFVNKFFYDDICDDDFISIDSVNQIKTESICSDTIEINRIKKAENLKKLEIIIDMMKQVFYE